MILVSFIKGYFYWGGCAACEIFHWWRMLGVEFLVENSWGVSIWSIILVPVCSPLPLQSSYLQSQWYSPSRSNAYLKNYWFMMSYRLLVVACLFYTCATPHICYMILCSHILSMQGRPFSLKVVVGVVVVGFPGSPAVSDWVLRGPHFGVGYSRWGPLLGRCSFGMEEVWYRLYHQVYYEL